MASRTSQRLILTLIMLVSAFCVIIQGATFDKKFFKKIADNVWSQHPELFDPGRPIPDSIADNYSAVILGCFSLIEGDYGERYSPAFTETYVTCKTTTRKMVKLLDRNAVEEFSKHEFGQKDKLKFAYITLAEIKSAFGVRIHKPDGSVVEVDLSEAFALSEGKKHKDRSTVKNIIDIPGLEVGDVLEYFDYKEEMITELDPSPLRFEWIDSYPVLDNLFECRFDPRITVEYRSYNYAPELIVSKDEKGNNCLMQHCNGVVVLNDKRYVRRRRELPYYGLYILNNTSSHRYYPSGKRSGGVYGNLLPATVYFDILKAIADSRYEKDQFQSKVKKIVKNYISANPDASKRDILNAAWTAAVYVNNTNPKLEDNDYWLSVKFADLARSEQWADTIGIGFLNSRQEVPTTEIVHWKQPSYGVIADGLFYNEQSSMTHIPGELLADYQGEEGGAFIGPRNLLKGASAIPHIFKGQAVFSRKNRGDVTCTLNISPDNELECRYKLKLNGTTKEDVQLLTSGKEWVEEIENYLCIDPKNRIEFKEFDPVERQKEIEESTRDYIAESLISGDFDDPTDINITSRGLDPKSPSFDMTFTTGLKNAVADAGNSLVVSVGKVMGNYPKFEGAERQRQTSAYFGAGHQYLYKVRLKVPEGYEADKASVDKLFTDLKNKLGIFFAQASIDEAGDVIIEACERINYAVASAELWDYVLALADGKSAFNDAVVVLNRK